MKNKKFDAVKMMREIRSKISTETAGLTDEEFIEKLRIEFPEIKRRSDKDFTKRKVS